MTTKATEQVICGDCRYGQLDLRTSECACCNSNTTLIEVVTLAVHSIADGLKVDCEEQLSTCWVQIHRQSDTSW